MAAPQTETKPDLQGAMLKKNKGIIRPLCNASRGKGGYLDLIRYCLIHIESNGTEHYEGGRRFSKTVNLALRNG